MLKFAVCGILLLSVLACRPDSELPEIEITSIIPSQIRAGDTLFLSANSGSSSWIQYRLEAKPISGAYPLPDSTFDGLRFSRDGSLWISPEGFYQGEIPMRLPLPSYLCPANYRLIITALNESGKVRSDTSYFQLYNEADTLLPQFVWVHPPSGVVQYPDSLYSGLFWQDFTAGGMGRLRWAHAFMRSEGLLFHQLVIPNPGDTIWFKLPVPSVPASCTFMWRLQDGYGNVVSDSVTIQVF